MTWQRAVAIALVAACNGPAPSAASDPGAGSDAVTRAPLDARPVNAPPDVAIQQGGTRVITLEEPVLALPHQESFRLLDAGKGGRTVLRYQLAAGTTRVTARTQLTSRHLEGSGSAAAPVALPAIRDGFAATIAAARPGQVALEPLAGEAAADTADARAYLAPWRTLLQGRGIALALDDRGAIGEIRFDDDPAGARSARARDELVQRLLSLIVPLPAEPVAPGARWRVVTILRQGPAVAKQTATYTLIARRPTSWKLHVQLRRTGQHQPIDDPSLPQGTTAELIALFRALEGDVEIDPRLPLVAGGALSIESRLHARLQSTGQSPIDQMFEDLGTVTFTRCAAAPAPCDSR